MFYSVGIFRTSSLGDSISITLRELLQECWEWWGEVTLYRNLQQRAGSLNIKSILWIKENLRFQAKEFSALLSMGRCKSLSSLNRCFLMHLSCLGPASCVFSHPEFFSAYCRECRQPDGSWVASIPLLPGCPDSLELHARLNHWWLWHPCLLTWQEMWELSW